MEDFRLEDLRSEIYPQSGTDRVITVENIITVEIDRAVIVDSRSVVRTGAGRPQPPPEIAIAGVCICSLCFCICRSATLSCTIRTEVFVHLSNAEQEYFVGRVVAGGNSVRRILVCCYGGTDNAVLFFRIERST